MKRFVRVFAPLLLLTVLTLSLAACGDDDASNRPPTIAAPDAQNVVEGQRLDLVIEGSDPDGNDGLQYEVSGAPDNASLNAQTGNFSWTPRFDQIGVHHLTYTVSDGMLQAATTVRITVEKDAASHPEEALAGGTLDPLTIPKFVTPLVIPPVMKDTGTRDSYEIAQRQFQQQILPGGIWNTLNGRADGFPATTVWSYGPAGDPVPDSTALGGGAGIAPAPNSQLNYPAYTIETTADQAVAVKWINDLVDAEGNYLPHLLPVDQTLHWANPPMDCADGRIATDCTGDNPAAYTGPVPMVPHVHGAHVAGHSDGYPEAWWLPAANDIPAGYAPAGRLFDDHTGTNPGNLGYARYVYRNDQPATTLWYHDHSLGITRTNVYAGPAGFWLIRGEHAPAGAPAVPDATDNQATPEPLDGRLPGPAPAAGDPLLGLNSPDDPLRSAIREIPVVIQDRAFNTDGSLFYPEQRAFFEGIAPEDLDVDFAPDSDILPTWNPEAFFNVMVVNGVSWPRLEVAAASYRLRLLNGCNSRFLNLALFVVDPATGRIDPAQEIPFYQIGTEQGALPGVVRVSTGFVTTLPGDGTLPTASAAPDPDQALLMGLAERADVIVDFSGLADGTIVRMVNTGPDEPFGGFDGLPGEPALADPATSGQIMQFVVNADLTGTSPTDPGGATPATAPEDLVLSPEPALGSATVQRSISLNEEVSSGVCVEAVFDEDGDELVPAFPISQIRSVAPADPPVRTVEDFDADCEAAGGVAFGPAAALLGNVDFATPGAPVGVPLKWTDTSGESTPVDVTLQNGNTVAINVTENPVIAGGVAPTEDWDIYNFTADAHPIHLHLVRFEVIGRTLFDGTSSPNGSTQAWEAGYKDTVIAYPGEITRIRARFDIPGLYVWHCHILEHEDNEMMRPYVVSETP